MTTIAIVGAGEIGGSTAQALAGAGRAGRLLLVDPGSSAQALAGAGRAGRLLLVDPAASAAAGKALDLRQAGVLVRADTRIDGTDDVTRVAGCDVCVVADRFGRAERATEALAGSAGEWRGDEGLALVRQLAPYLGRAPIVFAGTLQADLLAASATGLAIDRRRLIGSAPDAFAGAAAAIVALEADGSALDVRLAVVGMPPSDLLVPWSEASIGGFALPQVLAPVQLRRIEARAAVLWPPGPYALGAAAARVVAAILSASRQSFCVMTQLDGEFGIRGRPGCLPVRLGTQGIVETRMPELTVRERVRLQTALEA